MAASSSAPRYIVPRREIVAVEHPMVVKNIDNALKTFGTGVPLKEMFDAVDYDGCLPLHLRINDPTCAPILSHNVPTSNVLLRITVPKRTGRKRKRGSQDPFVSTNNIPEFTTQEVEVEKGQSASLQSHSRLDNPNDLLRKLKDNAGRYQIEPVGNIEQTHRFRGLADFHYSTTHGPFMTMVRDTILTGDLSKMKKFKLDPSRGVKRNGELIPPPAFTDHPLPFNWGYHQNVHTKIRTDESTGEKVLINSSNPIKIGTQYIAHDQEIPLSAPHDPPDDPILRSLIADLQKALDERPIWTRRALTNHVGSVPGIYLLKPAVQYIGYQFRGGPWRDTIIRFGLDPRKDPKYRIYQTLFFKIFDNGDGPNGTRRTWKDLRSEYTKQANQEGQTDSHLFDGKTLSLDGKVWQICDITEPLIQRLATESPVRETCDINADGWYCNGTMAKIKAVMRTKISAIQIGREMKDEDFAKTLAFPDEVKDKRGKAVAPTPDWKSLDAGEAALLSGVGSSAVGLAGSRRKRIRGIYKKTTGKAKIGAQAKKKTLEAVSDSDPRVQGAMDALKASGILGGAFDEMFSTATRFEDQDAEDEEDDEDDETDDEDEDDESDESDSMSEDEEENDGEDEETPQV